MINENKKGVKAVKYSLKTKNPVAKAHQTVGSGSGAHSNKKKNSSLPRNEKHKKAPELAESNWYNIRLKTMLEDASHDDRNYPDHEIKMAGSELLSIAKNASELLDLIRHYSEQKGLDAWQQSKITKAADYLNSVLQSINGEQQGVAEGQLNELDMFAPRTVYFKMADGNYIKADYRGSEGLGGHTAYDNVTFTSMSWVPPNTASTLGLDKFLAKGSDPDLGTVRQNAQGIVGTNSAGEGPFGNRTIDVVDFVNGKQDTVPLQLKTQVMQWVQKNQSKPQAPAQGVAEGADDKFSAADKVEELVDQYRLYNKRGWTDLFANLAGRKLEVPEIRREMEYASKFLDLLDSIRIRSDYRGQQDPRKDQELIDLSNQWLSLFNKATGEFKGMSGEQAMDEAVNAKQQAATAINMQKTGKKPKSKSVSENVDINNTLSNIEKAIYRQKLQGEEASDKLREYLLDVALNAVGRDKRKFYEPHVMNVNNWDDAREFLNTVFRDASEQGLQETKSNWYHVRLSTMLESKLK
jgi:hypothetical protein